jgi:calcineurin-like phosphoesterase family protein
MLSFGELNSAWEAAVRRHAGEPMVGEHGPYKPIGSKSMALLEPLWKGRPAPCLPDVGAMLAAGRDVRIFGDPHFEHANIIRMCERPFETIEAMDASLWAAVDEAHREADFVLCVGDLALKNPISWQRKIADAHPGKHATVVGNHDAKGSKPEQWIAAGAFATLAFEIELALARSWVEAREPGMSELVDWKALPKRISVGVSHWPLPPQRLPGPGWINLHGHVHNKPSKPLRVNCSIEALDYAPRSIAGLVDARVLDELARRQRGLAGFDETSEPTPGDSTML